MLLSSPKPVGGKLGQLEQHPVSLSSCDMVLFTQGGGGLC